MGESVEKAGCRSTGAPGDMSGGRAFAGRRSQCLRVLSDPQTVPTVSRLCRAPVNKEEISRKKSMDNVLLHLFLLFFKTTLEIIPYSHRFRRRPASMSAAAGGSGRTRLL